MGREVLLIQWYSHSPKGVEKGKTKNWFFKNLKILYIKKNDNSILTSMKISTAGDGRMGIKKVCCYKNVRGTTSFLPLPPPMTIYMYLNYLYIQFILYMWYPHKQCKLYMWYHFYSACKIYVLRVILRIKNHLFIYIAVDQECQNGWCRRSYQNQFTYCKSQPTGIFFYHYYLLYCISLFHLF